MATENCLGVATPLAITPRMPVNELSPLSHVVSVRSGPNFAVPRPSPPWQVKHRPRPWYNAYPAAESAGWITTGAAGATLALSSGTGGAVVAVLSAFAVPARGIAAAVSTGTLPPFVSPWHPATAMESNTPPAATSRITTSRYRDRT